MSTQQQEPITDVEVVEKDAPLPAVREEADLAIPEQDAQALAALDAFSSDDPWAKVDSGDLSPEPARISHLALNRKVDGGFVDAETGEKTKELDFIWLAKGKSRAWWAEAFGKGDAAPGCRSFDGVKADPTSPDLQNAGDCLTCPHARWANGDPPACSDAVEALVFLPDPGSVGRLARIRWNGMSVSPARAYWGSFEERLPKRPPMSVVTHVELEEKPTDNGTFLVPRFSRMGVLPFEQAQPLIAERDRRIAEWQEQVAADVVDVERQGDEHAKAEAGDPFAETDPMNVANRPEEPLDGSTQVVDDGPITDEDAEAAAELERERQELGFAGAEEPDFS